jgi:DNA-binding transcriptional LysR family regulator
VNKIAAMQTFVAILDHGSLTAAAEALGKALPTVVRSLALLEEDLGVRLLRRTTRRMSLTEEGRIYLERCRQILSDIEETEQALSNQQIEPRGELRVTAPVLFGQLHVAPAIIRFLGAYTDIKVELLLLDRVVNMVEEGIDVGIRIGPLEDSSMIATRVGEVRRVICASPNLLKRVGTPTHPRELAELPCVHFQGLSAAPVWNFAEGRKPISIPVDGPFTCNQAAAAVSACVEGLGAGRFLSYQVEALVAEKKLEIVLEEFEPAPIPIHVVFAHVRLMTPRVRVFVDWMKEALANASQSTLPTTPPTPPSTAPPA